MMDFGGGAVLHQLPYADDTWTPLDRYHALGLYWPDIVHEGLMICGDVALRSMDGALAFSPLGGCLGLRSMDGAVGVHKCL
jgi:hypothetical protein